LGRGGPGRGGGGVARAIRPDRCIPDHDPDLETEMIRRLGSMGC